MKSLSLFCLSVAIDRWGQLETLGSQAISRPTVEHLTWTTLRMWTGLTRIVVKLKKHEGFLYLAQTPKVQLKWLNLLELWRFGITVRGDKIRLKVSLCRFLSGPPCLVPSSTVSPEESQIWHYSRVILEVYLTDRLIESIDDICKKPSFTVLRADVKTSHLFGTL